MEKLNQVVCEYEHMWTKTLGEMTASRSSQTVRGRVVPKPRPIRGVSGAAQV